LASSSQLFLFLGIKTILMKNIKSNVLYILSLLAISYIVFSSNSAGITGRSVTGCGGNGCHQASGNTTMNLTGIPISGYKNDSTYTMTLTISNAQKQKAGFDLTVNRGSITASAGTNLSGPKELTHSVPATITAGTATWTFDWKAPSTGDSSVLFFVAANAVDNNTHPSNDEFDTNNFLFESAVTVVHDITTTTIQVYPNPASQQLTITDQTALDNSSIQVYSSIGIQQSIEIHATATNRSTLDISGLANGTYFIRLGKNKRFYYHPFVKL
jgi:hypothetical protein